MSNHLNWEGTLRKLWPTDTDKFRDHLMRLDKDTRRSRFACQVSDAYVEDYARGMSENGSIVHGYVEHGEIRAVAELKKLGDTWGNEAEAGFSVEPSHQDKGIGTELMGRVIRSARNRGVHLLFMSCLAENAKMRAIARNHEAGLRFEYGEIIGEIIPQDRNYFSMVAEAVDDRVGYLMAILDLQSRKLKKAA